MNKKQYKITWGGGFTQICRSKLELATILFELLEDHQSVKVELIQEAN